MLHLHSCGYHTIHNEGIVRNRPQGSGNYTFVFFKSKASVSLKQETFLVDKHTFILFAPDTHIIIENWSNRLLMIGFIVIVKIYRTCLEELHFRSTHP